MTHLRKLAIGGQLYDISTTVRGMSISEFNTMSDEEKKGLIIVIDEASFVPTSLLVQDYDTDDGWHIRKWSDGHVEAIKSYTEVLGRNWTPWGGQQAIYELPYDDTPPIAIPTVYTKQFYISESITANGDLTVFNIAVGNRGRYLLTYPVTPDGANSMVYGATVKYTITIIGHCE